MSTSAIILSLRYDSTLAAMAAEAGRLGVQTSLCAPAGADIAALPVAEADVGIVVVTNDTAIGLVRDLLRLHPALPLIVMTPADDIGRRIEALSLGAADYLVMPCLASEFAIRVHTVNARFGGRKRPPVVAYGQLALDPATSRLRTGRGWLAVTPREQEALALMLRTPNRAVSKTLIKRALADGKELSDNAIEVLICRLRTKARAHGLDIQTSRGLGYVLSCPPGLIDAPPPTP